MGGRPREEEVKEEPDEDEAAMAGVAGSQAKGGRTHRVTGDDCYPRTGSMLAKLS